jgi:hypothetical protein
MIILQKQQFLHPRSCAFYNFVAKHTTLLKPLNITVHQRYVHEGPGVKKVLEKCIGPNCKDLTNNISKITPTVKKHPTSTSSTGQPTVIKDPKPSTHESSSPEHKGLSQSDINKIKKPLTWLSNNTETKENQATAPAPAETVVTPTNIEKMISDITKETQAKSNVKSIIKDNATVDSVKILAQKESAAIPTSIPEETTLQFYEHISTQYSVEQKQHKATLLEQVKSLQKNNSGKTYSTIITVETTSDDLTEDQLKVEMTSRELIKIDPGNTSVSVKLQDDSVYVLGIPKNGIKLTSLGQAYSFEIEKKFKSITPEVVATTSGVNFKIIVPPKVSNDIFIEDGKQKHLLVAYDTTTGKHYAIGYLTSKTSANFLADKQYKYFENNKENTGKIMKEKPQFLLRFTSAYEIPSDEVKVVKYSSDYLSELTEKAQESLEDVLKEITGKKVLTFDNAGLTKDDCLKICKLHDINIANKQKHPLTPDQIKLNELNKQKQKGDNINTKETFKNNINNDSENESTL